MLIKHLIEIISPKLSYYQTLFSSVNDLMKVKRTKSHTVRQ